MTDAWFRDLRPKALSDAKRQGLPLKKVRDAAGHTCRSTPCEFALGHGVQGVGSSNLPAPAKIENLRPHSRPFVQRLAECLTRECTKRKKLFSSISSRQTATYCGLSKACCACTVEFFASFVRTKWWPSSEVRFG